MSEAKHPDEHMVQDTPELGTDTAAALPKGTLDPVYEAKAHTLNNAIQDIGMGWYVYEIFPSLSDAVTLERSW